MAALAVIGGLIHKTRKTAKKEREEQERRMNSWHGFSGDISEYDFLEMVKNAKRGIKRLKEISVDGPIVHGIVRTQSGLSEWHFKADFNDYGQLTGTYWLSSDNDDSSIPKHVADIISSSIHTFSLKDKFYDFEDGGTNNTPKYKQKSWICPYCGKAITVSEAKFCGFCGKDLG